MELKIGDRVKIREDLEPNEMYGGRYFDKYMLEYAGQFANVENIYADGEYFLNICDYPWVWSKEMLIPVAPASCPCGLLSLGLQTKEVSMDVYREQVKMDPILSRKYFRRYKYCPDCARLIDWGQDE